MLQIALRRVSDDIVCWYTFIYGFKLEYLNLLEFDGSTIRLKREPNEGEIQLQESRRDIIKLKFQEIPEEDQKILESAAIIGYKFDADLLAQIWNQDILLIIHRLENLEGIFIVDQSAEDNIYSFLDRVTHDVIFEIAKLKNGKNEMRQLIVEYQKRIIRSIVENKNPSYIKELDVDILYSATERCFKYSSIKEIRRYTNIIGYEAVFKLAEIGERKRALSLFEKLINFSRRDYSENDICIIFWHFC